MNLRHVLALSSLLGCSGPVEQTDPPATTPPSACEAELTVTHGEGGCFGGPEEWEFKADLAGCAAEAVLSMWRTDGEPWDEAHPMTLDGEGPDRIWQAWFLGPLPHRAPQDGWSPGETSAFDCQLDADQVTFGVQMFDSAGAMRACAVWGHDPDLVIAGGASSQNTADSATFADCEARPW